MLQGSLSDGIVLGIAITRTGAVWVGTSNGLNEFDPATKRFTAYDTRDGSASSVADCVLDDTRGKLWMATTKGISSFDPSTRTFRNFSTIEGLPGPEMAGWGASAAFRERADVFCRIQRSDHISPRSYARKQRRAPNRDYRFPIVGKLTVSSGPNYAASHFVRLENQPLA